MSHLIRPALSPSCLLAAPAPVEARVPAVEVKILGQASTSRNHPHTMPLYKLTSKRLARKEKEERRAAAAEDSDASSVSDAESEDSIVLSDEEGESQ